MLWIYDDNSAGNIQAFWLLTNSAYRVTLFSDFHTAPLKSKLGVCEKLSGDTARTQLIQTDQRDGIFHTT